MSESRQKLKQKIVRRAKGCCEYCVSQASFSPDSFSVEHIITCSFCSARTPTVSSGTGTAISTCWSFAKPMTARYDQKYAIDDVELAYLAPRVQRLLELAVEKCRAYLDSLPEDRKLRKES